MVDQVREAARPLADDFDLDPLMERIGDARFVLLGEASHGTSEFYTWRTRISERLIREKGFSFIAVEGDWPDCYRVNRYVRGLPACDGSAEAVARRFERWPSWMWANREVVDLIERLRRYNDVAPVGDRVGFYGLDVYSLWESLAEVVDFAREHDPGSLDAAQRAYRCFESFEDEQEYARATRWFSNTCEDQVVSLLAELRRRAPDYPHDGGREAAFDAEQNALVARNAEHYYRTMASAGPESWNIRDRHMAETLDRLMAHHGREAKAIVWEHNTHVGDARATNMARSGMVNVGQLVREAHGDEGVVIVGFGSHRGSVIAGQEWGAPMERMRVPAAREGSWEDVLHQAVGRDSLLILDERTRTDEFLERRGHRAIGVVYHPDYERHGNYVPTVLPDRYDAFVFIDESHALHPLHMEMGVEGEVPETYPSGV